MPKVKHIRTPYKRHCDYCKAYYEGRGKQFCSRSCWYEWSTHRPRKPLSERFWSKVDKKHISGCWLWMANKNTQGYGSFDIDGKGKRAHRVAYELHYGSIPKGKLVCHHCDNPSCVRPDHLFLGTQQDNVNDMVRKGRACRKLTDEQILSMRALYKNGISYKELSQQFDTVFDNVYKIINRQTWKHI